jgi:TonB family protein
MPDTPLALLAAGVLLTASPLAASAKQPAPDQVVQAHPAPRFDPAARCPGLRSAVVEDQPAVVVLFHVGVTGVPSQASVHSTSRSEDLDAAAVSCVLKLRFLPATRLGDGTAVESWQELALQWTRPSEHRADPAAAVTAPPVATPTVSAAAPSLPAADRPSPGARGAVVRACIDATGKLAGEPVVVRSSGDPGFDRAALGVARTGAVAYRPAAGGGQAVPGCLRLAISPDPH